MRALASTSPAAFSQGLPADVHRPQSSVAPRPGGGGGGGPGGGAPPGGGGGGGGRRREDPLQGMAVSRDAEPKPRGSSGEAAGVAGQQWFFGMQGVAL